MSEKNVLNEIILGYRKVISGRYVFDNIQKQYEIPASFDEEKLALFRDYFLEYVYPHPDKREELDEAFQSLDNYIKHPEKLLRLVLDSSSLIFKYGRHLPKILKAGVKALKSFRAASNFEKKLVQRALAISLQPPYNKAEIDQLLSALSQDDVDQFVDNNISLFETLYDKPLIKKITEIVEYLIKKMKKRPNIYSAAEVRGLEIGRDIIIKGNQLFEQLPTEDQQRILELTIQIERDALNGLISKN